MYYGVNVAEYNYTDWCLENVFYFFVIYLEVPKFYLIFALKTI
jgi:hypothetical protein